jgi:metal-responsive CopG/Arc/MetJ family transcriptional regulator
MQQIYFKLPKELVEKFDEIVEAEYQKNRKSVLIELILKKHAKIGKVKKQYDNDFDLIY